MATTTPNFGWPVPTSTDLVKDGATAMEALGDAIDTSMVDLKGGTTGQVLAKASNTDMDFSWVAQDDSNAIQNTIVDAKGDLIAASAADTPARLAVGSNGETLVADSSTSTGLRYQANFAAGKNKIINGDFGVWQRGTSFTTNLAFCADRFVCQSDATFTVSQQTFTPGAAPVAGYEGQYYLQFAKSAGGTFLQLSTKLEDVRTFAGQTVTISAWMRVTSGTASITPAYVQNFGSGGSGSVAGTPAAQTIDTNWTRYSFTIALPSVSGKTIGAGSNLEIIIPRIPSGLTGALTVQVWGLQLEAGSVATAFQTATGTIQGELAACQRYYYRMTAESAYSIFGYGGSGSTTTLAVISIPFPVTMRSTPSSLDASAIAVQENFTGGVIAATLTLAAPTKWAGNVDATVASGLTQYRPERILANNNSAAFVGFSAEL